MLCLLLLLSGCAIQRGSTKGEVAPVQTLTELENTQKESIKKQQYSSIVKEFNVGFGTYESPAGKKMPYDIKGIIGVPEGSGPFPLVLITHGSHSNDDENLRFDTGYNYLVETLAKQGIVAVSMDMSKAYTWKYGDNDDREKSQYLAQKHLDSLIQAQNGGKIDYPVDLTGKIDLKKIALAGHSRGGETIFDIAEDMNKKGMPVSALLCIAPTYQFIDRTWPEGKVALVVPEYDGDVISLDGFALYDVLGEQTGGEHLTVFLKGANHNYFNRNISRDDSDMLASWRDISGKMSRSEQENFLQAFASDFFYSTLQEDGPILSPDELQPDQMYGEKVAVLYRNAQSHTIFLAGDDTTYAGENLETEIKIDSWFFKYDEVLVDTITYGEGAQQTRKLLKIDWSKTPAALQLKPSINDLSGYRSLMLDMVVDAADEKNWSFEHQRFTVRLIDAQGNTASVKLPDNLEVLMRASGELDSTPLMDETIYYWSIPTPLSSLMLPLAAFDGVNLAEVESIELLFGDTSTGSLLIDGLRVQ